MGCLLGCLFQSINSSSSYVAVYSYTAANRRCMIVPVSVVAARLPRQNLHSGQQISHYHTCQQRRQSASIWG